MITTFEQAFNFVMEQRVCTVFGSKGSPYPSLWDNTGLSEKKPSNGGWSPKVMAIWDWKTRLPQMFPEQIYYGKVRGGDAALIEMQYFCDEHFPAAHKPVSALDGLAQEVYQLIQLEPDYTGPLRTKAIERLACTKSQFESALKRLQISLNIVRSYDQKHSNDFWLPMREVHLDLVLRHE